MYSSQLLSLPFDTTQRHLSMDGIVCSSLHFNQEHTQLFAHWPAQRRQFLIWGPLFPGFSSLCQVDKNDLEQRK